jgi:uncharacterized protein YijF (DUF1287 family)
MWNHQIHRARSENNYGNFSASRASINLVDLVSLMKMTFILLALVLDLGILGCGSNRILPSHGIEKPASAQIESAPVRSIIESAISQTTTTTGYTQDYFVIPYPNGDVPAETGACTDVVIRAFRAAGVDLQKEVHEDMAGHFAEYPKIWGLAKTDSNIDHRRVPNLRKYFERRGKSIPITSNGEDYRPGDVISWDLNGKGMTHIGVVSNLWNADEKRHLIVHNIGAGARAEDRLFEWKITGHYRYFD